VASNDIHAGVREELQLVDDELADLRRQATEIRRRIGDRDDMPGDAVDLTVEITEADEVEAIIETLERRRRDLLERLTAG
jgi:gamma-glutamyl:cysteine ligase YbdK (ATP-grasp superfamily)